MLFSGRDRCAGNALLLAGSEGPCLPAPVRGRGTTDSRSRMQSPGRLLWWVKLASARAKTIWHRIAIELCLLQAARDDGVSPGRFKRWPEVEIARLFLSRVVASCSTAQRPGDRGPRNTQCVMRWVWSRRSNTPLVCRSRRCGEEQQFHPAP